MATKLVECASKGCTDVTRSRFCESCDKKLKKLNDYNEGQDWVSLAIEDGFVEGKKVIISYWVSETTHDGYCSDPGTSMSSSWKMKFKLPIINCENKDDCKAIYRIRPPGRFGSGAWCSPTCGTEYFDFKFKIKETF
jgi:hypothetical protein